MTRRTARTFLIGSFLLASHALAQPDGPPPRPQDEPLARPSVADGRGVEIRESLESRLQQIEQEKTAIERALGDLEAGRNIEWPIADMARHPRERTDRGGWLSRRGSDERPRVRGDGPPREPRAPREPVTEAQRIEIMAFLKEHDPRMLARFDEMSAHNPEFADRMLERFGRRTLRLIELKEEDPERFESQLELTRSHGRIRDVMTDAIKNGVLESIETRETLGALIASRMDMQEAEHDDDIYHLAERIAHLREERSLARERRSERVEQIVDRMIKKAKEFRDRAPEGEPHD